MKQRMLENSNRNQNNGFYLEKFQRDRSVRRRRLVKYFEELVLIEWKQTSQD